MVTPNEDSLSYGEGVGYSIRLDRVHFHNVPQGYYTVTMNREPLQYNLLTTKLSKLKGFTVHGTHTPDPEPWPNRPIDRIDRIEHTPRQRHRVNYSNYGTPEKHHHKHKILACSLPPLSALLICVVRQIARQNLIAQVKVRIINRRGEAS